MLAIYCMLSIDISGIDMYSSMSVGCAVLFQQRAADHINISDIIRLPEMRMDKPN